MSKTVAEINRRIERGTAVVLTAEEMTQFVADAGPDEAAATVDVVTTGTFGAMCSSGLFFNTGHADPPIRMSRVWLDDVEAYAGLAAVDAYLGATQPSDRRGSAYGGAHVIEALVSGRRVVLRAVSAGTDCYPRKELVTELTLDDLNQAVLTNPRNGYQRYAAATNSGATPLRTYMGVLTPSCGCVTYSGAGALSPLANDPQYRTIGVGTRIFLGGGVGYVAGAGTQHDPTHGFGTLMVHGDLHTMSPEFLRAAVFRGYGCTLYVGLGVPIPILDRDLAVATGVSDEAIDTPVVDYGVPRRSRPVLRRVTYAELRSGAVELGGRRVPAVSLSSLAMARRVAVTLKDRIRGGEFLLSSPVAPLPTATAPRTLTERAPVASAPSGGPARDAVAAADVRWWGQGRIGRSDRACVSCGCCLGACPAGVFERASDATVIVHPDRCLACLACADACPLGALRIGES